MEEMMDLAKVRQLLRDGIAKGYWTLEDLDEPSPGFAKTKKEYIMSNPLSHGKYEGVRHKNLLRDDIPEERVDFAPAKHDMDEIRSFTDLQR